MTRGSVRFRLTVLFAGLFLAAGAGLLGITYGLLSHANNGIISVQVSSGGPLDGSLPLGSAASGSAASGSAASPGGAALIGPGAADGLGPVPGPQAVQAQANQYVGDTRAREDDALLLYVCVALVIMVVVAAGLGWFVAGRALRPLRRITESARRISATNLHERLALEGPDDDVREVAGMIDGP